MSRTSRTSRIVQVTMRMQRPGGREPRRRAALADRLRSRLARRRRRHGALAARAVHALAQLLARLEVRHVLLGHLDLLPGLRVAAGARGPIVQAEAAEPPDLD